MVVKRKNVMVQHTHWLYPESVFVSAKGMVTHEEWLKGEQERINSDPSRKAVIREKVDAYGRRLALFVNDVREPRVPGY